MTTNNIELENELEELRAENEEYLQHIIKLSKNKADTALPTVKKHKFTKSGPIKEISLKQLKEMIEDIYLSKEKHDLKLKEGKQPRETMEQFLIYYLNQKYGLKQLINDWHVAIYNALTVFKGDPDVTLFHKILNHEIEENFRNIFKEVKKQPPS